MPPGKKTSAEPTEDAGSAVTSTTCPANRKDIPPTGRRAHHVVRDNGARAMREGGRGA